MDTCASANFISENLAEKLNLTKFCCSMEIGGIDNSNTSSNNFMTVTLQSRINNYKKIMDCFIVPTICDSTPEEIISRQKLNIPSNWPLADPEFFKPSKVDMIIGAGATILLLSVVRINISQDDNDFFLQKTRLGWVIVGGTNFDSNKKLIEKHNCMFTTVEDRIEKFLQIEEINLPN